MQGNITENVAQPEHLEELNEHDTDIEKEDQSTDTDSTGSVKKNAENVFLKKLVKNWSLF